jgi:hypothetical protein
VRIGIAACSAERAIEAALRPATVVERNVRRFISDDIADQNTTLAADENG